MGCSSSYFVMPSATKSSDRFFAFFASTARGGRKGKRKKKVVAETPPPDLGICGTSGQSEGGEEANAGIIGSFS